MNIEAQINTIQGLVIFQQQCQLTPLQRQMAQGHKQTITIDWGDFQKHWRQLFIKIRQINAKRAMLRNNRYSPIIKQISHVTFPHLISLNLSSNSIRSLQFLYKIHLPIIQQLNLENNEIISVRSLAKCYIPTIETIKLNLNPMVDRFCIFMGNFPRLSELGMNQNEKIRKKGIQLDSQLWRIKNAPQLTTQISLRTQNISKYSKMIRQKPCYFPQQE